MSPAEMHVYHDHPHETLEAASACPVSIQMQTYRRTGGRSHRRNNFHIASRDKRLRIRPAESPKCHANVNLGGKQ